MAVLGCAQIPQPPRTTDLDAAQSASSQGYAHYLQLFQEPELLAPASKESPEVYRLLVVPTFSRPLSIRIERRGAEYFITSKTLSGQGGYDPGHLQDVREYVIMPREWHHFKGLLQESAFWLLPAEDKKFEPDSEGSVEICLDGSTWLLEGLRNGEYHAVERYCPELPTFEACGHFLLELSQLEIPQRDLY